MRLDCLICEYRIRRFSSSFGLSVLTDTLSRFYIFLESVKTNVKSWNTTNMERSESFVSPSFSFTALQAKSRSFLLKFSLFSLSSQSFVTRHKFSPDAFVQMAFQAAYYTLYGRAETTYEPAMTKSFLHGRTEAIRTVQPWTVNFTKVLRSSAKPEEKLDALRKACEGHSKLSKACAGGQGHDR